MPLAELVGETLAAVADRAVRLCRKWGVGLIVLEKGLGKLRSAGKNRSLNRRLNGWPRNAFAALLARKARLAGIRVVAVWGGYSSTIGNLAFAAPDACAAAAERARRGLAAAGGHKDVLPAYRAGWVQGLRKDLELPAEAVSWAKCHRTIKAAKIGYRRPHPSPTDSGVRSGLTAGTFVASLDRGAGRGRQ
jgi:IS605 OrfB family transposase